MSQNGVLVSLFNICLLQLVSLFKACRTHEFVLLSLIKNDSFVVSVTLESNVTFLNNVIVLRKIEP